MSDKLKEWKAEPQKAPRLSFISGIGGKSFCAGGDIVSLYHAKMAGEPVHKITKFFGDEYILDYSLS
jgi:enoyl-CoA hydratase/carnithine racemase